MGGWRSLVVAVGWVSVEDPDVLVSLLVVQIAAVIVVVVGLTVLCSAAAVAAAAPGGPPGLVAGAAAAACSEGSRLLPPAARDRKLRPDTTPGLLDGAGLDGGCLEMRWTNGFKQNSFISMGLKERFESCCDIFLDPS